MKRIVSLLVLPCLLLYAGVLFGASRHGPHFKVNATASGQDNGDGTTSGDVDGGGVLHGAVDSSFVLIIADPVPPNNTPGFFAQGTVIFTNAGGSTLTVSVFGPLQFDDGSVSFSVSGPIVGGTGMFAGATGTLSFDGIADQSSGEFTETITGEIAIDRTP